MKVLISLIKILLFPIALLYDVITRMRNFAYDTGIFKSKPFEQPSITVGNLTVGGTGKTPQIEWLVEKFLPITPIAIISRGYGRKTKGLLIANDSHCTHHIGDEPEQYYKKWGTHIPIVVAEKRVEAQAVVKEKWDKYLVLLDDAFQHRAVSAKCNVMLCDYGRPFYEDFLIPAGLLRESRTGAKRADVIVVTKCPDDLSEDKKNTIKNLIRKYTKSNVLVFFSRIKYELSRNINNIDLPIGWPANIVCGLANPKPFLRKCKQQWELGTVKSFPDHHHFQTTDLVPFKNDTLMVSEKDYHKCKAVYQANGWDLEKLFYLPIKLDFFNEEDALRQALHRLSGLELGN